MPRKTTNAVALYKPAPLSAESKSAVELYARAAADPAFPLDRLERLMDMKASLIAKDNENAFWHAMGAAQKQMKAIVANANNEQTKSKYATYDQLDAAVRPIYSRHGFMLTFDTEDIDKPDYVRVVCFANCYGHKQRYHIDMPADGKGAKGGDVMTRTHATKSAISYGQSTLLTMIFNLAVRGKRADDDGNAAGAIQLERIDEEQLKTLRALATKGKADLKKFCAIFRIKTLDEMPSAMFDEAVKQLERKVKVAAKPKQEESVL
jgi:hypothetical protein